MSPESISQLNPIVKDKLLVLWTVRRLQGASPLARGRDGGGLSVLQRGTLLLPRAPRQAKQQEQLLPSLVIYKQSKLGAAECYSIKKKKIKVQPKAETGGSACFYVPFFISVWY